jgi:hypothetical protein
MLSIVVTAFVANSVSFTRVYRGSSLRDGFECTGEEECKVVNGDVLAVGWVCDN